MLTAALHQVLNVQDGGGKFWLQTFLCGTRQPCGYTALKMLGPSSPHTAGRVGLPDLQCTSEGALPHSPGGQARPGWTHAAPHQMVGVVQACTPLSRPEPHRGQFPHLAAPLVKDLGGHGSRTLAKAGRAPGFLSQLPARVPCEAAVTSATHRWESRRRTGLPW